MIISTHLPKTAGSSFAYSLKNHFGDTSFKLDYKDWPINTPKLKRNFAAIKNYTLNPYKDYTGVECIHGHFLPFKYLGLKKKYNVKFITWVRDPIQRMASHYYFWKRTYNPKVSPILHRKIVEENWTLEEFCLSKELRNFYNVFLWGFDIKQFSFIGVTEYFDEDMKWFSDNILKVKLDVKTENVNNKIGDKYNFDEDILARIKKWHSKDEILYQEVLKIRDERLKIIKSF